VNGTIKRLNETVTVKPEASYPEDLLTYDQIKKGGFLIYIFGKFLDTDPCVAIFYFFYGISLVTQNYINPSIDIIKAKGIFSADTINATLLAFTNSAAECFIIMNSIFFGVSDIGISTVVQ